MKTLCSIVAGLVLLITTTVLSAANRRPSGGDTAPFDGNQLLTWCTDALRWMERQDMVPKTNREVVFANAGYCRGFIEGLNAMNDRRKRHERTQTRSWTRSTLCSAFHGISPFQKVSCCGLLCASSRRISRCCISVEIFLPSARCSKPSPARQPLHSRSGSVPSLVLQTLPMTHCVR